MALAVCMLFDSRSDRLVRQLWQRLEARGVATLQTHTHGRHVPHLSLAVLREWDLEAVAAALAASPHRASGAAGSGAAGAGAAGAGAVEVAVQGAVVFPRGRVALACSVTPETAARQAAVVAALVATDADLHRHYAVGRWVPHVSVATSVTAAQLPAVVASVSDVVPLTLRAEHLVLVDTGTGRHWPVP